MRIPAGKIDAIKLVRELGGVDNTHEGPLARIGLKDAKDAVEGIMEMTAAGASYTAAQSAKTAMFADLNLYCNRLSDMACDLHAIKLSGLNIAEARSLMQHVDRYMRASANLAETFRRLTDRG